MRDGCWVKRGWTMVVFTDARRERVTSQGRLHRLLGHEDRNMTGYTGRYISGGDSCATISLVATGLQLNNRRPIERLTQSFLPIESIQSFRTDVRSHNV